MLPLKRFTDQSCPCQGIAIQCIQRINVYATRRKLIQLVNNLSVHVRTHTRTYVCTHTRTYVRTYVHTYIHTLICTRITIRNCIQGSTAPLKPPVNKFT